MTMDAPLDTNDIELVSMAAVEDEEQKRAHHNALERKRRDHIKDSFYCLRDAVPQLRGEKASRALILNKATDYIKCLKSKNMCHKKEIDDIKKQNDVLEQEIDKIIELNNSLGKERIELIGEDFVKVSENNPQSTPPTFSRITEKDIGPFIGKQELDTSLDNAESNSSATTPLTTAGHVAPVSQVTSADKIKNEEADEEIPGSIEESSSTIMKIISKPDPSRTEDIIENKISRVNIGSQNKIAFSQGHSKNGGTIQIPASALAKALPNGFKNVTAIYKQTGNNKPIRLQIITHNGSSEGGNTSFIAVKDGSSKKKEDTERKENVVKEEKVLQKPKEKETSEENGDNINSDNTEEITTNALKDLSNDKQAHDANTNGVAEKKSKSDESASVKGAISTSADNSITTIGNDAIEKTSNTVVEKTPNEAIGKTTDAANDEAEDVVINKPKKTAQKDLCDGIRTPQNQPLYAKHRPLHASPAKEKKLVAKDSEFDCYITDNRFPGDEPNKKMQSKTPLRGESNHKKTMQALPRDPSAIATISESELAFLTRPSNPGKDGESVSERNSKDRNSGKIEHGNIPILYKGSLLSDRDKEVDDDVESPHKQILYGARAMDGSRPFACHICGKSFNMLSSLKVHEHIHVPVKKKPYPCDLCHRSFMTLRILSQHKESHYGRISSFHRQSSLGKKSTVSFATHPQSKNGYTDHGSGTKSPRTAITNMFHVRASSPGDVPVEKSYTTVTIAPTKPKTTTPTTRNPTQRVLPTTHVRQGQVIVQARAGAGATAYKVRTKLECEEARNFGLKVVPLKRSSSDLEFTKVKDEHLTLK